MTCYKVNDRKIVFGRGQEQRVPENAVAGDFRDYGEEFDVRIAVTDKIASFRLPDGKEVRIDKRDLLDCVIRTSASGRSRWIIFIPVSL